MKKNVLIFISNNLGKQFQNLLQDQVKKIIYWLNRLAIINTLVLRKSI